MKRSITALMLAAVALAACVKQQVVSAPGLGPSLVLEQFLNAVNAKDYAAMARLFGNREGPIPHGNRDEQMIGERRMFALATLLTHDTYEIVSQAPVAGRSDEAVQQIVQMKAGQNTYRVPFTMVRYKDGWLVEIIGIEAVTYPK